MSGSELRRDLVTGDWIVMATGRAKRPHSFAKKTKRDPAYLSRRSCPFEPGALTRQAPSVLTVSRSGKTLAENLSPMSKDWFAKVVPNKFPAFTPGTPRQIKAGIFDVMEGAGFHELVIIRDHNRHWADFTPSEAAAIVGIYRERYQKLIEEPIVEYISIFHNYGREAGASIYHPHSQILAIPVVPPDVQRSYNGSTRYFEQHKRCVHCDLIKWEMLMGDRVVAQNDLFVSFCPFVSRTAFEIRVFPKDHEACFNEITDDQVAALGDILRRTLRKLHDSLGDPSYNFFIHTSTGRGICKFPHYHWHMEIIPKVSLWAGFELATGVEISTVDPAVAAGFLRGRKR